MTQEQFFNRYKYDRTKDRIGGGGFGNVYKVFDTIENENVALKIAEVKQGQESLSLLKEVELASSLERHVNIARYTSCHRFDLPNGHFDFGILQYYPLGNLSQLVKSKKLSHIEKEQIAKGVISGIQHLHNNNIVHRDLKSANILIAGGYQGEYVPKIADFGLSKQFSQNENSYFSNSFAGGSLLYVAPEQLEGKELRKNVDLWSLGVVLFELFVGDTPFRANVDDGSETARAEIISKIRNASIPSSISNIPSPWQDVIKVCLVTNPSNRVKSVEEIQLIVNGKISVKKDSDRTEVDLGSKLDTTSVDSYINNENRNESANGNSISLSLVYLLIIVALGYVFWKGLEGKLGGDSVKENSEINKTDTINISKRNEEEIWQEAVNKNIESAYVRYLFLHPEGKYEEEAKDRIKKMGSKEKDVISANSDKSPQKIIEEISSSMVKIPGGSFIMGCTSEQGNDCNDNEKPTREENVKDFYIMKHEVTQELWESIIGYNPSYFKNCLRCPIESVSLNDVRGFIIKLNKVSGRKYRLPTEIEWEYAARGGHKSKGYKYSGSNKLSEVAWFTDNSSGKTHEILQKRPNELGLYDMSGNVWEWTSSNFGKSSKVIRGGAWTCFSIDCRVSHKGSDVSQNWSNDYFGFRLASD